MFLLDVTGEWWTMLRSRMGRTLTVQLCPVHPGHLGLMVFSLSLDDTLDRTCVLCPSLLFQYNEIELLKIF